MKRLLSLNLILVMLLGMLPATAMAAESTQVGEGSYAEYITVDGTQYDTASDDRISGDGWTYQSGILTLTGYRGGAIETNVKLSVFFDGENTVTAKSGHGISSTAKLTLRPAANSAEDSSLAVYAAEGYHAVFTEGTAEIWPSALTLVGGGTSAVSAARITYGSYWPHTLKVGDDAESAVEGEYTTQNYYAIELIPCFMTLYGNGGTTEDGEESYRFQVDFTTGTGADLFLYDRQDVFAQDGKEQVGWGVNPEGTGITYSHSNGYSYANGNYDAALYALWNDTHVEIRRIWENTYGSVTWTSDRSNVVKIGESYTLPNVNREGYTLDGWRGDDGVLYAANTSVAVTKSATYTAEYTPVNATASKLMFRQATWDRVNGVYYEDETKALSTGWDASIESGNLVQFYFGTEDECVKVGMDELTTTDGVYLYEQDGFVWIRGSGFGAQQIIYTDAEGVQYTMPVNIGLPPVSFYSQPKASEKTYIGEYAPVYVSGENNVVYVAAAAGYSVFDVVLNENFDAFADVEVAEDGTHAKITVTESFADGRYGMSITYGTDKWSTTMTRRLTLNNNNPKLMFRHMAWDSENLCHYENAIYDLQNSWYSYITSGAVVKFYFGTKDEYTEVSLDQLHSDGIRLDVCEEQFIYMEPTDIGAHEVIYTAPDGVRYALPVTVVLPSLGFYSTPEATEKSYLYQKFTVSGENNTFYLVPSDGILTKVNMSDEFAKIAKADIAEDGSYAAITVNGSPSGRWYELTAELESDDWSWTEHANLVIKNGAPHLMFRGMEWDEENQCHYEDFDRELESGWNTCINSGHTVKFYFGTEEENFEMDLDQLTSDGGIELSWTEDGFIHMGARKFGSFNVYYPADDGTVHTLPVTVGVPPIGFYSEPVAAEEYYLYEKFTFTEENNTFYLVPEWGSLCNLNVDKRLAAIADVEVAEDGSYAKFTVHGLPGEEWCEVRTDLMSENGDINPDWGAGLRIVDGKPHLMFRGMEWDEENECHYEDFDRELESGWNTCINSGHTVKFYFGTEEENFEMDLDQLTSDGGIELSWTEDGFIHMGARKFGSFNVYYPADDGTVHTLPVTVGVPPIGFYSEPVAAEEYYLYEKFTFTEENNTFYLVPEWGSLCNLNVDKRLAAIADVEVAEDGSYAKFTVHGLPGEEWCEVRTDLMSENGDINPDWGASLRIVDGAPHLMFRSMAWDDENQCHYEDPEHPMQSSWETRLGSGTPVRFYFGTEDDYVYVPVEKLTVSSGLYLSPDVDFVHLGAEAFGWQEITYAADDGILHILPVTVGLPELGFYKDKTASVENFLYDSFVVTGENNTFYLVSTTNTITDVMLNPSLAKIATVEVSEDGSYAAITVTGSPSGYWYSMLVEMKNGNWTGSWNRGLNLIDGNPHLMFREADWTPETGWFDNPNMGMQTSWSREINSSAPGRFFFGTDEKYVPVSLKQLSVSGDGIEVGGSDDMLWLNCLNEGVYYVTYTADDGAEYTFRVNVYLPALGFYTKPVASGEYFTRVYTVSEDNNNVLYLMPSEGTLTKLALGERLAEIAEVEWAKDGSCVAIIITGIPDGGWYDVTATYETAKGSWAETVEVLLKNGFESEEPEVPEEPEVTVEVVDEGQCGDYLYWVLAVETDAKGNSKVVLTFDGSGEMYDYMTSDPDWFPFNDEIEEIRLSEKQTSIGAFAFGFMDGIYSIVIPASVKSIGSCAFAQCVNLHEVVFEGGAPAIAENAFNNVTAACLYPENNATWTTVVRANYGGKLDWVAYDAGTGDGEDSGKPHLMYYMVGSNGEDGWADMGYGMEDAWYFDGTYLCCQVVFCFGTEDNWVPVDFNQLWVTDSKAVELTDRGYTDEGYSVVDVSVFAFGDYSICYKDTDGTVYSMPVYVYLPSVGFFSTPVMSEDSYLHQFVLTETNRTFYLVSDEGDIVDVVMDEDYVDCTEVTIKGNYAAITFTKDPAYTWCRPYLNVTTDRGEDGYGEWGLGLEVLVGEPEEPEVPEISASGTCGMYGDNLIWTLENGVLTISGYGEMQDCSGYTAPWNAYYSNIKEVVVEEGVTTIGPWAFAYCEQMTKVTLPETLNVIDYGAFVLCSALEKVTIPAYVTLINSQAFCNCTALSEVYFLGDAPKFNEDMYPGLDSFANVVADCYYPADNTTWTADVMLNYGGYDGLLTWVPYTGDIEEPDVPEEPENGQLMFYHVGENAEGKWADMGWGMQDGWYSDGFGSSCVVFCFGTEDKWTPVNLSNLWVSDSEAVVLAIRGETVEGYSAISMAVFAFGDFSVYYEAADGTVYSMPVHVYPPDVGFYSRPVISGEYYLNQFNVTETNRTFYLVSDRGDITDVELNDGFADCTEVTVKGNYVTITFTEIPDFTEKQLFVDVYIDKDGTGVGEWSAGRGVQIVVGESGGDVEEPDVPSDDYAVSDLYLDAVNGEVYLCWTAPKTAPKGEVWYTACFSCDGGKTWEYGVSSGACDETCVSLSGMPLAWYHDETVTTAFKVITEVDGVEVAECIANLTLSVEDQQLPAANVTVTAPAVEGGKYTFTVTGLTPNTAAWLIGQNYNSGSVSGGYSDEEGTCTFTWSSSRMEKYLADATSVYLVRELTGASAAKDGLSATYTISNRGDWASIADAVNGGGSEEPEQPDDLAVTDLHFEYLGVMPYLYWTAPAGVEGDLRYNVHVSTDNGKTWTMLSSTSQDMISLTGLDAAVYNAIKVETELNDVVVAQSSAKLTLTVTKGKDLPAATVVFTAPETEGENYKFTISGLTPYTQFDFVMKRANGSNSSGSRSDADGKYSGTKSYSTMSKYLADSTSVYLVKEFSGGYVSEDGLSAAFTVSNRGDWALVSDAVNGGGSEEPEQPDEPKEDVLTRAGVCVAIVDAMGWEYEENMAVSFDDLSEDHEAYEAIAILAYKGIVTGIEGKFNPDGVLSREQLAVILCKVLEEESVLDERIRPADVPATSWSAGWICTALNQGLMTTDANNNFRPTDSALVTDADFSKLPEIGGDDTNEVTGQCGDNLFWALKSRVDANGENCYELIITGTGAMYDFTYKNLPGWWDYMKQIKWIELPEGMTSVSAHAFENCYYVTELTIPDSVESLGENAFVYMSYLEKLDLGEGLKTIGRAAFYGCDKSLKEVVIPDSVTYIGVSAFASCDVLEKVTLGSGLITIDDYAFEFDENLTEIVIPDSVTEIGSLAFNKCYALTKVSVGSGVKSIDYRAFANCINLTEVTFTGDAPVMGREAFVSVTAKCLYPAAKAGWTTEMLASYGGNLTWEPYGYTDATQKVGMIALELVDKYPVLVWTAPEQPREDLFYRVVIMDGNGKEWMRLDTDKTRVEISDIPAGNYSVRVASCFGEAGLEAAALETSLTVLETASKYAAKVMIRAEMDAVYFSGLNPDSLILFETDCSSAVARMYADSKGLAELYGWEYAAYAGTNYRVKELSIERADNGGLLVLYTALGWTAEGEGWYSVDDALPKAAAPESIETEGLEDLTEEEAAAIVDAAAGITVELVADQVTDIETGDGESVEVEIVLDVAVLGYETPVVDDGSAIIGGSRNLVLDIEPKAVVTTTDSDGVSSSVTQTVDTTGVYVTVKIPLPAGFAKVGEQLYVIHTKDSGARTVHAVKVQSDENGVLFVSFMNANGFSTFDVTANIASVNGVQYDDLNEALKAAEAVNGTVTMLFDTTVTGVVIPSGVTLNLADTTLTAGYVVGLNGSYLTANANSGKLVVNKGSLVLPEEGYKNNKGQYILPIWDPSQNCYLFSLFVANTNNAARGLKIDEENETSYFQFKQQATGDINKGLLADGASDNALKIIVRLVWNTGDGEAYQDFVYNDRFVGEVTGSKDYTFTLTGYTAMNIKLDTLSVTAMIVTDSGATAFGDVWTKENAK